MTYRTKNIIALSLIPQIILVKWLGSHPEWIEKYYSNGLYPVISKFSRAILGWIPFSIGEILIITCILLLLKHLIWPKRDPSKRELSRFKKICFVLSLLYFSFNLLWGLNYYRIPLQEKFGITNDSTFDNEELIAFTEAMIAKTNAVHYSITKDTAKAVVVPYKKTEILNQTMLGYKQMEGHPMFNTLKSPSIKKSMLSTYLSYTGTAGYINPLTNEAQLNSIMPLFELPFVASHEVAHQAGYSAENEASFIGYLAAITNDNVYFKYSAYTYALRHCLAKVHAIDKETHALFIKKMNSGVIKNYQESAAHNKRYENPIEPYIRTFYSYFLKANSQKEGIKSYSSVVSLLMAHHKQNPL